MKISKILIIICSIIFSACGDESLREMFTPGAYKATKVPSSERNKQMISRIEANIAKYTKQRERGRNRSYALSRAYLSLGERYLDIGDFQSAINSLESAVKFDPDYVYIYYLLGVANANLGRETNSQTLYQNAERFYKKAVEIKPTYYDAWYGLAILLFYAINTDLSKLEAITILQKLTRQHPKHYRSRFALALFYYETHNAAASLSEYESLLKDLSQLRSNSMINEYKERCRENIAILMSEIARNRR